MSPYRRGRKDVTHKPIVAELEAHGLIVFDVSGVPGLGFDIVCCRLPSLDTSESFQWDHGKLYIVGRLGTRFIATAVWRCFEIKSDKKIHHKKIALTDPEQQAATRAPIPCIESAAEALTYF